METKLREGGWAKLSRECFSLMVFFFFILLIAFDLYI